MSNLSCSNELIMPRINFGLLFLVLINLLLIQCKEEELSCVINGKKSINTVSDKFLSFSVDPALLIKGNISWYSLQLVQHLIPAYIRIGGPSTQFLEYTENENYQTSSEEDEKLIVSSFMWESLNNWLKNSNLTPIFALNENNKQWNAQSTLPLLENADKLNIPSYWQISCGSSKTIEKYRNELITFRNILNGFPSSKNWKIVGSKLESCLPFETSENTRKFADDLVNYVDAIIWEEKKTKSKFLEKDLSKKIPRTQLPFWAIIPKVTQPVSFTSGLEWAKQIGETAKAGYEVIFRQPRLHEFFSDTPVYWISLLHKTFMGRIVLDVKFNNNHNVDLYANCAKKQNQYSLRGAVTIFAINYSNKTQFTSLRLTGSNPKISEVQSYTLTSKDSTGTYLNGKPLGIKNLTDLQLALIPTLRRTRSKHLSLELPPKSVSFFVLPTAKAFACIHGEDEMNLLLEELEEDQNIKFSDESTLHLPEDNNLIPETKEEKGLVELYQMMEKELESDQQYYKKVSGDDTTHDHDWKQMLLDRVKKQKSQHLNKKLDEFLGGKNIRERRSGLMLNSEPKSVLPPSLKRSTQYSAPDYSTETRNIINEHKKQEKKEPKSVIENKEKPEENHKELGKQRRFTDTLLKKARQIKMRNKLKGKRIRRDINMDLLRLKTGYSKKSEKEVKKQAFRTPQEIQASIRRSDQTSDEFPSTEESSDHTPIPDEVFAEIARDDNEQSNEHSNNFNSRKSSPAPTSSNSPKKSQQKTLEFNIEDDVVPSVEEEDLHSYHSFHEDLGEISPVSPLEQNQNRELWEIGELDRRMDDNFKSQIQSNADEIQKMVKNLDSFLKQTKTTQDLEDYRSFSCLEDNYDDISSSEYKRNARGKRETKEITIEDIRNYKRFLKDQLRLIRSRKDKEFTSNYIPKEENNRHSTLRENRELKRRRVKKQEKTHELNSMDINQRRIKRQTVEDFPNEVYSVQTPVKRKWKPEDISSIKVKPSYSAEIVEIPNSSSKERPQNKRGIIEDFVKMEDSLVKLIMPQVNTLDKDLTDDRFAYAVDFSTTGNPKTTYLPNITATTATFPLISNEDKGEIAQTSQLPTGLTTKQIHLTTVRKFTTQTPNTSTNQPENFTTSSSTTTDFWNEFDKSTSTFKNIDNQPTIMNNSSFWEKHFGSLMEFFLRTYKGFHDVLNWFN